MMCSCKLDPDCWVQASNFTYFKNVLIQLTVLIKTGIRQVNNLEKNTSLPNNHFDFD